MRLLDRYIIKQYLFNYMLALAVMMGMYILLDLIINFDRFTSATAEAAGGKATFMAVTLDILDFYGYQMLVIFQQVAAAIPLLAAGFTMVRMTRHNELTAMLASGVSLYRVAVPIMLCAVAFSCLLILDQEVLMPHCVDKLLREHDQVNKIVTRTDPLYFVRDTDSSLLIASQYDPANKTMKDLRIIQRDPDGTAIGSIMASKATWDPTGGPAHQGTWILRNVHVSDDRKGTDPTQKYAAAIDRIDYTTSLTPAQLDLVFTNKAVEFLSSSQIMKLVESSPEVTRGSLVKIMHMRFSQPLMNLVLLMIGIPFLLTREPRRLIVNMIYCTAVTGMCFVATFVIFQMAGTVISPVLGAWLPVLAFGPVAVAMLDAIKT